MEKREDPTLPEGPRRRNGVIPFQMAPPVTSATPLNAPAPPQGTPRRNGVISFQMLPPASSVAPLSTPARPKEQKRLGGPFPGVTSKTAASAATVDTTEPAPKKRLCGSSAQDFPLVGPVTAQSPSFIMGPATAQPPSFLMGPATAQPPSFLMGPAIAQPPSFGSSNIRNPSAVRPWRSETGPSEAVPISIFPASQLRQQHHQQQQQRDTSALNNKLAGVEKRIAGQEIEKAGSKQKESATKPRIYCGFVVTRESARFQDPEEIAKLSAKLSVLGARYKKAKRHWMRLGATQLRSSTGIASTRTTRKHGRRFRTSWRKSMTRTFVGGALAGKALLERRQKQAQPGMPNTKVTSRSTPRGPQPIKRLKHAQKVKTHSLAPAKAADRAACPPPPSQPQAGQDSGEGPSSGVSQANEATTQGELTTPDNDSDGAVIPAPVTSIEEPLEASSSMGNVEAKTQVELTKPNNDSDGALIPALVPSIEESLEASSPMDNDEATPLVELTMPNNDSNGALLPAPVTISDESLEAGSSMGGVEPTLVVLLEQLEITPTVPQQVEDSDMMVDPADIQMAEVREPQDGPQSGEDLPPSEGDMEWEVTKECVSTPWTPTYGSAINQHGPQAPQAVLSAPAVPQPTQNAVEYEYPWSSHPQAEKRMGPAEGTEWTVRKQHVTRAMVVKAGSELLARVEASQQITSTAQVAEEPVRKTGSLLLAQDELIRAEPVQSFRVQDPAPPVSQARIESVQAEEASTSEVVSQSAVPQPAPNAPEPSEQVPLEVAMSVPAVPQPALAAKLRQVRFETGPMEVPPQATVSEPAGRMPTRTVLGAKKVATEVVVSEPAALQRLPATSEPSTQAVTSSVTQPTQVVMDGTEKDSTEAVVSGPALSQQDPAALEPSPSGDNDSAWSDEEWWSALESQAPSESGRDSPMPTMPGSYVFDMLDEVVSVPAATELVPDRSKSTSPMLTDEVPRKLAASRPARKESDSTWPIVDKPTHGSLRTATCSHLEVTAAFPVSTSSQVASLQDASATETARAGVLQGTEMVEDADSPATLSDEQAAVEQREPSGGREAASGQKPGDQPRTRPAVTASEAGVQEGSALLGRLWAGARWLAFAVCVLMILFLCSFPLGAKYLGHLRYETEGPVQFLSELREEHGGVQFLGRLIYVFLRCFAGDRTWFG
ncbi:hypothetical protein N7535_003138 [Penicillium sp. DV-2018c]|nr:hypothetical protein N7535_003138 [Penicillium sp. DV-2018c]